MQTTATEPSLEYMERLYSEYLSEPDSVPEEWRGFFQAQAGGTPNGHKPRFAPSFRPASLFHPPGDKRLSPLETEEELLRLRLGQLIHNYRVYGHLAAHFDPLRGERPFPAELDPASCGLSETDMGRRIPSVFAGAVGPQTPGEILQSLRETYCGPIGVQFMHIDDAGTRQWLQERMETPPRLGTLSPEEQRRILARLTDAVTLEQYIRRKFIGAKSFSLEGSEGLIPLLDAVLERAADQGVGEIVLGMAHRGRLNVLANLLGKSPGQIFREFGGDGQESSPPGDVKYHLGHSCDHKTSSGQNLHLSLCFNPSHLEFINPVALGRVRAKQDRQGDRARQRALALLIHGDAAMAGEGITQETLNLMSLPGYTVGGALHVVINNQIGFTTLPAEGRSSEYATDVALMLRVPIFHVNGEDPEAMARVARLAMDFREEFKRDVFIDMLAYRRLGHNESDEPSYTQPLLYREIGRRKPVREQYLEKLLGAGIITQEEAEEIAKDRLAKLETAFSEIGGELNEREGQKSPGVWRGYFGGLETEAPEVDTALDRVRLADLLEKQTRFPADFHPHPKIQKAVGIRLAMARGEHLLDWSAAEAVALASIAADGGRVRLSGQDSARGTFSQRHAVLYDYEDGHPYVPLQHLQENQGPVEILNSPLSEAGVLGFEYGYSLDWPDGLILWEAQFGDFVNAAQVIVDQFLACAEEKWRRLSGLVLLLPHGLEGMGPEHSSARIERFLALAARDNIQIVYPTTPAQYFHCLRRQFLRRWRKPLVVMTPKGLLRHPAVVSPLADCADGRFQRVLPDRSQLENVRRVLLCSGKVYFELEAFREKQGVRDVAIVRLEQLYPFPEEQLRVALQDFPDGTPLVWVQEEPLNMGAWRFLRDRLGEKPFMRFELKPLGRTENASPATGSASHHREQQQELLTQAFATGTNKHQTLVKGIL